jgi:hypothetical protein
MFTGVPERRLDLAEYGFAKKRNPDFTFTSFPHSRPPETGHSGSV